MDRSLNKACQGPFLRAVDNSLSGKLFGPPSLFVVVVGVSQSPMGNDPTPKLA